MDLMKICLLAFIFLQSTTIGNANESTDPQICTANGDPCVFPFEYGGATYNECLSTMNPIYDGWCFTDKATKDWTYCKDCPTSTTTSTQTSTTTLPTTTIKTTTTTTTLEDIAVTTDSPDEDDLSVKSELEIETTAEADDSLAATSPETDLLDDNEEIKLSPETTKPTTKKTTTTPITTKKTTTTTKKTTSKTPTTTSTTTSTSVRPKLTTSTKKVTTTSKQTEKPETPASTTSTSAKTTTKAKGRIVDDPATKPTTVKPEEITEKISNNSAEPDSSDSNDDSDIGTVTIVVIILSILFFIVFIALLYFYLMKLRKSKKEEDSRTESDKNNDGSADGLLHHNTNGNHEKPNGKVREMRLIKPNYAANGSGDCEIINEKTAMEKSEVSV